MEWTESLKRSIKYMEAHLLEDISTEEVAEAVYMSPFYFQKGFKIMTGYSVGEYIRNRRLYLAALDVLSDREKIIDLAYKYGYDTPESFTRAFSRFHGAPPLQVRADGRKIKTFLPLAITVTIQGGDEMDYVVEKMEPFQVIGFQKVFSLETAYEEIPKFWNEFCENCAKGAYSADVQKTLEDCHVGEFAISVDDMPGQKQFHYFIAGEYKGGQVPEGMEIYEAPACEWAKFKCSGPMPAALQTINTRIFNEWLPGNPEYEIAFGVSIEWYAMGDIKAPDYESGIWIPVKSK